MIIFEKNAYFSIEKELFSRKDGRKKQNFTDKKTYPYTRSNRSLNTNMKISRAILHKIFAKYFVHGCGSI